MRIIKTTDRDSGAVLKEIINRVSRDNVEIEKNVRNILSDVEREGDKAVIRYTELYDGISLKPSKIRISRDKVKGAFRSLDRKSLKSLNISAERIRRFHEREKPNSWFNKYFVGIYYKISSNAISNKSRN